MEAPLDQGPGLFKLGEVFGKRAGRSDRFRNLREEQQAAGLAVEVHHDRKRHGLPLDLEGAPVRDVEAAAAHHVEQAEEVDLLERHVGVEARLVHVLQDFEGQLVLHRKGQRTVAVDLLGNDLDRVVAEAEGAHHVDGAPLAELPPPVVGELDEQLRRDAVRRAGDGRGEAGLHATRPPLLLDVVLLADRIVLALHDADGQRHHVLADLPDLAVLEAGAVALHEAVRKHLEAARDGRGRLGVEAADDVALHLRLQHGAALDGPLRLVIDVRAAPAFYQLSGQLLHVG